jgi:hypothetical protein
MMSNVTSLLVSRLTGDKGMLASKAVTPSLLFLLFFPDFFPPFFLLEREFPDLLRVSLREVSQGYHKCSTE